jgi:putative ABC transport system permease protein
VETEAVVALDVRPTIRRAFRIAVRRRDLVEAEVDAELQSHVELRIAQLMTRGLTREQAEAEARRRFGVSWAEAVRRLHDAGNQREARLDMRERLDAVWSDVTYAVRTALRQPAFSVVVVLTFALGIGANATIFGVIDQLLLRPPPHVAQPQELFQLGRTVVFDGREQVVGRFAYPVSVVMRSDSSTFDAVAVSTGQSKSTLNPGARAEQIYTTLVSAGFFDVLGTRPSLGRFFQPEDDSEAATPSVVLSHGFWQRRFGGDRSILGQTLRIGPRQFTVIGVAPPEFRGVGSKRIDAWIPIAAAGEMRLIADDWKTNWSGGWVLIHARLRAGVTRAGAEQRIATSYANANAAWRAATGRRADSQRVRFVLQSILPAEQLADNAEAKVARLLAGVVGLVLLIACANVANLLLARGAERQREIAVRMALGVSRARLLRLLVSETVVLAVAGGVLALMVTQWSVRILHATLLEDFAWTDSAFEPRVIAVTLGLVALTTTLAGIVPALKASNPDVTQSLKAGGREGGVDRSRMRAALLVMQAALSVVLIVGTGLFVQSLRKIAAVQLGYQPTRAIAATMGMEALMGLASLGAKPADRSALFARMRDRIAAIPGVEAATLSSTHPLHGWGFGMAVQIRGRDSVPSSPAGGPYYNAVGAEFFSTLGIRLSEGRAITSQDVATNARVAVLSEAMARAYWPNETAVGRCVILGSDSGCTTVVGVAVDALEQLKTEPKRFLIYVPAGDRWDSGANVIIARVRDPAQLVEPIRRAIQTTSADLPYAEVQSFDELLAPQVRPWKAGATLFATFGLLAVVIATLGLYSAISYSVTRRAHEFGVRMALGAQARDVVSLVVSQGLRPIVAGVGFGVITALIAGRLIASILFDTSPRDPIVYLVVTAIMVTVAIAASAFPARRASRVDPATALRGD